MRAFRLITVLVATLAIGLATTASAGAASSTENALAQAKLKSAQARAAANAAATRLQAAQTRYEQLGDEVAEVQVRIADREAEAQKFSHAARTRAIQAYKTRGAEAGVGFAFSDGSILDGVARTELLDRLNAVDNSAVDRLSAVTEDLAAERDRLSQSKDSQGSALASLKAEQKLVASRLAAAEDAERDYTAKLAQEKSAAAQAQAAAAKAAAAAKSTTGGVAGQIIVNPGGAPFVCPVQGARAFTNDWGQARSGGRAHQGNDIMSPGGTPNVAVVAGTVAYASESVGGNVAYLNGDNGITYYYAHLSGFAGGARQVSMGEIIGYTGNSGNAASGPTHTHFEIRPGGPNGRAVNPYPTLAAYC